MIDDREQTAGSEDREKYETVVLEFLDKAIAAIRPVQEPKEPSNELDVLVSDLLKQVISESDQPQVDSEIASEAGVDISPHDVFPEKTASFLEDEPVLAGRDLKFSQFEDSMSPFAEFMPRLSESPAAEDNEMQSLPKLQPSMFDDRDPLLAEFMFPQEESSSAKSRHPQIDLEIQASQFEAMDNLLAEFMPPQEESPSLKDNVVPFSPKPEAAQFEDPDVPLTSLMAPAENAPRPENKSASLNSDPEAIAPEIPELGESAQKHEVDAEKLEAKPTTPAKPLTEKAPLPENSGESIKPAAETIKHINIQAEIDAQKREIINRRLVSKSPIATSRPEKGASTARVVPIKTPAKSAPPVYAARVAHRGKTLLIAAACICLLAAFAIPAYFFTGSSNHGSKPSGFQSPLTDPLPAASQIAINGQVPAEPISQISPKYPQLAIKKQASGSVVLDLGIDSEGKVVKATPVSGPAIFHDEVIRTAMKWRYRPASIAGTNVPSHSRVTFNFHLM